VLSGFGMRRFGAWAQRQRYQRLQHGAALMKLGRAVSSAQVQTAPYQGRAVFALAMRTANHLALLLSGPDALVRLRAGVATTCGYPRPALPPAARHSGRPRAQGYNGISKGLMASFIFSASERFDRAVAEPGDNITNLLKGLSKEEGLGKLFAQLSTLAWAVAASQARPCQRRAARARTVC